jgi:hypothetical protein
MAETTIILGDWNSATPAAPEGRKNIEFAVDRTGAIPKFSASVELNPYLATFLVGIGAPSEAGENVAPIYKVKNAGTIIKLTAQAKAALTENASFMLVRKRGATTVDILTGALTIDDGSTALFETDDLANDDLEVDDELQLDILAGSPKDVKLELTWS